MKIKTNYQKQEELPKTSNKTKIFWLWHIDANQYKFMAKEIERY